MRVIFAGDIHLRPAHADDAGVRPPSNERFLRFLRERAAGLDRLVLLGDVFDYWIGPSQLERGDYREAVGALADLTRGGVRVDFLYGNRDYFVEEKFARATGVRIAREKLEMELGGRRVWCAHGDFIYNRNPKYAAYRRLMRFGALRAAFQAVPGAVGASIARGFRHVSRRTTPAVHWTDRDLLAGAEPFWARGVDVLICGHIHRPARLSALREERPRELFVVGDWDGGCEVVEFDGASWRFGPALPSGAGPS